MSTKLLAIIIGLAMAIPAFATENNLSVKFGMDINGKVKATSSIPDLDYNQSSSASVDNGFTVAAEYKLGKTNNIQYGIGAAYQFERVIASYKFGNEKFNFIPVYAWAELGLEAVKVTGSLGYNLYNMKDASSFDNENGFCYSIGAELPIDKKINLFAEYSVNNAALKTTVQGYDVKVNIEYSKIQVGLSYQL